MCVSVCKRAAKARNLLLSSGRVVVYGKINTHAQREQIIHMSDFTRLMIVRRWRGVVRSDCKLSGGGGVDWDDVG